MSKCSADETPVCCCMDVGTIMDNTDCTASYSRVFPNRAEAEETLAALSQGRVKSNPIRVKSNHLHGSGRRRAAGYRLCVRLRSRNADLPAGPALILLHGPTIV